MRQSNSYRRKNLPPAGKHSKWELTYGVIAMKLVKRGGIRMENVMPLAKFLAVFVYLYSFPYGLFKMLLLKLKTGRR